MFEKEAEEWRNSLPYEIDNDTFYNIAIPCMEFGYNKAKKEMIQNGLALQSDMDKTIEQNIALKKELEHSLENLTVTYETLKLHDDEEISSLQAQIEKMKDCLNKWYKQHNDDDYTETFYDNLLRDTEKCLWGDSVND